MTKAPLVPCNAIAGTRSSWSCPGPMLFHLMQNAHAVTEVALVLADDEPLVGDPLRGRRSVGLTIPAVSHSYKIFVMQ